LHPRSRGIDSKETLIASSKLSRSKRQYFSFEPEAPASGTENCEEQVIPPFLSTAYHNEGISSNWNTTDSHLGTATKFGTVVKGFRKPGHHIPGPPKNPSCPCLHCKIYFESLDNSHRGDTSSESLNTVRIRAYSLESRWKK